MLGRYENKRFETLKTKRAHVVINLMNGMKFEGTIYNFDDAVVIVDVKDPKGYKIRQTIYRHAMASFYTTSGIDVFSTTSDIDAFRV